MVRFKKLNSKSKPSKSSSNSISVSKAEFLKIRPIISPFVNPLRKSEDSLLLKLDLREIKKKKLFKRLLPTPDSKKIQLDKLGMDIFEL
ncbi:MAG: hypothetical protein ACXACR_06860, partial [Candidatus Hodarchaeales archaeon]